MVSPRAAVLCLMGPTASGKSRAALALAHHLPIEIISVDSSQVYRGMDIGTAKPSVEERQQVPHHLIDLLDPADAYSAARFCTDAERLIGEIHARERVPLLVGGTMLYFKALREGLDQLPTADAAVRAALDGEAAALGWPALHAELARVDPVTAARLAPQDAQRIQRALEVYRISGSPLSAQHTRDPKRAPDARFLAIALEPSERARLHARIEQRLDGMLEQGLVEEVRQLRSRPDLHAGLPSMRSVGYRQVWQHLDGRVDERAMRSQVLAATRQLAKRQLTWLRSLEERHVIDCLAPDCVAQVGALAARLVAP